MFRTANLFSFIVNTDITDYFFNSKIYPSENYSLEIFAQKIFVKSLLLFLMHTIRITPFRAPHARKSVLKFEKILGISESYPYSDRKKLIFALPKWKIFWVVVFKFKINIVTYILNKKYHHFELETKINKI